MIYEIAVCASYNNNNKSNNNESRKNQIKASKIPSLLCFFSCSTFFSLLIFFCLRSFFVCLFISHSNTILFDEAMLNFLFSLINFLFKQEGTESYVLKLLWCLALFWICFYTLNDLWNGNYGQSGLKKYSKKFIYERIWKRKEQQAEKRV